SRLAMASLQLPYSLVNLASAFLGGPWTERSLVARGKRACLGDSGGMRQLVRLMLATWANSPPQEDLLAFLQTQTSPYSLRIGKCYWTPLTMAPRSEAAQSWNVPALTTPGQLADWLGLSTAQLDWL